MGVRIKLNSMSEIDEPTLVLATRKGRKLGSIPAYNIVFKDCLNSYSEISFRVSKEDNGNKCLLWDKITDFKLLWCKEYDLWFEIYVEIDESNDLIKNVIGKTVCEAELSQINLYNIEINTEDDIAREDYKEPTIFYNEEYPENSLLNRLMEKIPHYTIAHVDATISKIQKTFSFDDKSIYDAFQEIAEEIGCIFIFGSNSTEEGKIARTISVYDLQSNCENSQCKYRGEFTGVCPKCGKTNIKYGYGTDTGIFISYENLAEDITYSTNTDSVKNCFKLEAGDDLMNATIRNCNPNGTDYLWHITNSVKADMSQDLVEKLDGYDTLYESYQSKNSISLNSSAVNRYNKLVKKYNEYREQEGYEEISEVETSVTGFPALMTTYYDTIDLKLFLQTGLMPPLNDDANTAEEQLDKLVQNKISPVAVPDINSLSLTIADSAVLGLAKIYISPNYTIKINSSSLSGRTWKGSFTVTNLYDDEDTATSGSLAITINGNIRDYLEQRVKKALNNRDTDKYSISNVFALNNNDFDNVLGNYSLDCLSSFYDACQAVLDILTEQSSMDDESGIYNELYHPYWKKLRMLEKEISEREDEISDIETLQDYITAERNKIQKALDFESYMGTELWKEFCAYRREDKYSNPNYISDGLDNAELFERAQEFIEAANTEIYKSSELQHSITSTLKNLLAMEEFQGLINNFEVGNWLRLMVDDEVYRLRLLEYEIDYDDLNRINVTFSDVFRVSDGYSDIESVLKQASSMASSYDTVAHQASQGDKGNKRVSQWVEKGLALTNSFISDSDNQEVVLDSHGFTMKEYLPITDTYSDKQIKIINKGLYVTKDNWETSRAGIGNFVYYDPEDRIIKEAYGVIADTLIGNLILGEKVGIYNKNNSITLDEKGFSMEETHNGITTGFDINLDPTKPNEDFLSVHKKSNNVDIDIFTVDKEGNAHFYGDISGASGTFSGDITGASGTFSGELSIGEDRNGNPVFIVDENGNVTMNGGITLGGSINWGTKGDPYEKAQGLVEDLKYSMMCTMYYPGATKPTTTPSLTIYENADNNTSNGGWHKSFDSTEDRWLSRSFDGGKNWSKAEKITALTYIDATGIYTGTLTADHIKGKHISTLSFENPDETNDWGCMDLYKQMIFFNEVNQQTGEIVNTKMAIGFLKGEHYNEPLIVMGAGDGNGDNIGYINKGDDNFSMYYKIDDSNLSYIKMYKNNNGRATIRINGVEFEQQDDDKKTVYEFMKKAGEWNDKLQAAQQSFKEHNTHVIQDGDGNQLNINPANLGEMFTVEGSTIKLRSDVVLSWNAVYALYAKEKLTAPTEKYGTYPDSSPSQWHKKLTPDSDYYVSYSYDGGKTWSAAVKIHGEDGKDGANGKNGKDGVVDDSKVIQLLQKTYNITHTEIDGTHIESPVIQGAEIYGGNIHSGTFEALKYSDRDTLISKMLIDADGITTYNGSNQKNGFHISSGNSCVIYGYYQDELRLYIGEIGGVASIEARGLADLYIGTATANASTNRVIPRGYWDFGKGNPTIVGLKVTFS